MLNKFRFFAASLGLTFFLLYCGISSAGDKIYLKCDGSSSVTASEGLNIMTKEAKAAVEAKPMSLTVVIDGAQVTINDTYEFRKIPMTFPDEQSGYVHEYGNLEIKDTHYDGYYNRESYKKFKDSTENPIESSLYQHRYTRFLLDRRDGKFVWNLTLHGKSSWLYDMLPKRLKNNYATLKVEGHCKKIANKTLF